MDIFLFILSITFMIVGIMGSIVPVLPGPLAHGLVYSYLVILKLLKLIIA